MREPNFMEQLRVVSIQRGCVYDGPGMRTTVFLKGCVLNCPWCCNPETIKYEQQYYVEEDKCLSNRGINSVLCNHCIRKGGELPISDCPIEIAKSVSKDYTIIELYDRLIKDISLFNTSGGGLTFSGGEPLLQSEHLLPLVNRLKDKCSIYIETTLLVINDFSKQIIESCTGIIVDLKLQRENLLMNRKYIDTIKESMQFIRELKIDIIYRMVFVNSVFEDRETVLNTLNYLGIKKMELLMCHNLASAKYKKLGFKNIDYTADMQKAKIFESMMIEKGIACDIISI